MTAARGWILLTATLTGERLAQERRKCGLSQLSLAAALGVAPTTLRRWEQTAAPIPAAHFPTIAAALWRARQAQMQRDLTRFSWLAYLAGHDHSVEDTRVEGGTIPVLRTCSIGG